MKDENVLVRASRAILGFNPHRAIGSAVRSVVGLGALASLAVAGASCATAGGSAAGTGSAETPSQEEAAAMKQVGRKAHGQIVWSSSRNGNHDLFVMDTDGSHVKALTKGDAVDWFPRFSPNGQRILFTRSKKGWVFERDANTDGKWDIYSIARNGGDARKEVDNASWGTWISNDEIAFARGTAVFKKKLGSDEETMLVDSTQVPDLDGALLQQPEMSRDGRWLALTLRGSKRETGIWDIKEHAWHRTGDGCQINWEPDSKSIYWVHPTGSGGSRILHSGVDDGKAEAGEGDLDKFTLIDLPGRRSHEYFPQLSRDGQWLVWAATQRGHDHDIADYEIYLWKVGSPDTEAVRLTYHSGNDRWPDIYMGGGGGGDAEATTSPEKEDEEGEDSEEAEGTQAAAPKAQAAAAEEKADEAPAGAEAAEETEAAAKPASYKTGSKKVASKGKKGRAKGKHHKKKGSSNP